MKEKINSTVNSALNLIDLPEFEEYARRTLFNSPPDTWCELENAICDFLTRKSYEIADQVYKDLVTK